MEERRRHRQNGVDFVKGSPEYLFLVAMRVQPPIPRHCVEDVEEVSKRSWEKCMMDWRHEVRSKAVQHGYSK